MLRSVLLFSAIVSASALCPAQVPDTEKGFRPFPENRVRDYYFHQAEALLDSKKPIPDLLPQYPGLDGGAFGHWGQNPASRSVDTTLNDVDSGNVICSHIKHFGLHSHKGVTVRLQDGGQTVTVLFDPLKLTFTDVWTGGFVSRGAGRFGVHDGGTAVGKRTFDFTTAGWQVPENTEARYLGFFRHGESVVFHYQIGNALFYDRMWLLNGRLVRSLETQKELPLRLRLKLLKLTPKVRLVDGGVQTEAASGPQAVQTQSQAVSLSANGPILFMDWKAQSTHHVVHLEYSTSKEVPAPAKELSGVQDKPRHLPSSLTKGGPGQWVKKTSTTTGTLGDESDSYAIDTLTLPFTTENEFGTPMRLAGVGALPGRRIVFSTLIGDVWVVSGVDRDLKQLTWQRIAAGLYQPLGLVVQDGKVILGGNDQVTRLHDLNGDGEADYYECVTNEYPTTGGHDFATSLQQDKAGALYWATASGNFGLTRLKKGSHPESLGNGLRNCNGIGVSPDGKITLATVQEGSWTPATAIFDVHDGSFHGHPGPQKGRGAFGYDLPQCFVPRGVDNSAGEILFLPQDERLGSLSGLTVGSSYGNGTHYLVLREEVGEAVQGGVVPLPGQFLSGACRFCFNDEDGFLYVAGTEGWQSYGRENGCLQRLRYTGKPRHLPVRFETRSNGLIVHFNTQLDPFFLEKDQVICQQWNYLFSGAYGSPEYSVVDEGRQGHDYVPVRSVHLLPGGKSVFLEIPQLHPVMQFHVHMRLRSVEGQEFTPDAYLTIYEMGEAFTDFPGYQLIAKRAWPSFPRAEKYEQDPRLVKQDAFGTNYGWVSSSKKISLSAVTGLQYEPRRLRVAPGTRVSLSFHNTDPSMPHNVVIVKADKVDEFGAQAMVLASNPRAIATHYVPDDPAEICFSPILNPFDKYTVYFEAPKETGKYRFLCTYPGHSRVMRGTLFVIPDDQPLPPPEPDEVGRKFVRAWSLDDLASDVKDLKGRSMSNGRDVFTQAGCIKCHRIEGKGSQLGPDLGKVTKQFEGAKLLKQILHPSVEINKKYQSSIVVTDEGKVYTGLITAQSDAAITLMPNPLKPEFTVTLKRDEIDEVALSDKSTMPEGLLMTFTKEEILDLLAFIQGAAEPGRE